MNQLKILRKILVIMALCAAFLNVRAEVKYLVVNLNDGTNAVFALTDNPVITNTSSSLQVKTAEKSIEVAFTDLKNYQLTDNGSGIFENVASEDSYRILNNIIYLNGLKAETAVSLFTLDGRLLTRANADADGHAHIDLSSISSGVFIVTYNNKAIKILIP